MQRGVKDQRLAARIKSPGMEATTFEGFELWPHVWQWALDEVRLIWASGFASDLFVSSAMWAFLGGDTELADVAMVDAMEAGENAEELARREDPPEPVSALVAAADLSVATENLAAVYVAHDGLDRVDTEAQTLVYTIDGLEWIDRAHREIRQEHPRRLEYPTLKQIQQTREARLLARILPPWLTRGGQRWRLDMWRRARWERWPQLWIHALEASLEGVI